jgi:hypothetical protein
MRPSTSKIPLHIYLASFTLPFLLLFGCTPTPASPSPNTPVRDYLPTIIALTVEALETSQPTAPLPANLSLPSATPSPPPSAMVAEVPSITPSPDVAVILPDETLIPEVTPASTEQPKPTPTRTPTSTPTLPIPNIQISRPGPASRVVSPIRVSAALIPGAKGSVKMELLGEDSRLLVRKILNYTAAPGARVAAISNLDFEIPGVAETGRLIISTEDTHGRVISLASVDLLLLSIGEEDLNPPGEQYERIIIREPTKNILIQGGLAIIHGLARPQGQEPLLVQMFGTDGKQVGPARLAEIPVESNAEHATFSVDIPYSVTTPTWVRITVSERDFRIAGTIHVSSVEVLLGP